MQKLNLPGAKILSLSECALSQLSYCLEQVQKLHRPPAIVDHGLVPRSWELVQEKGPVKYYINICYYNINRIPCLTSLFEEWQYDSHDISVHLTYLRTVFIIQIFPSNGTAAREPTREKTAFNSRQRSSACFHR